MFSRPHKPFGKGKQITADDLNWLKREATKILVGGPGMAVTRIGGKTVLSRVGSQSVQRGGYATIWKMTTNLGVVWGYDTGGNRAYGVVADDNYVYATCNREDIPIGDEFNVHALNVNGGVRWKKFIEKPSPGWFPIGPNDIGIGSTGDVYIGSYIGYFDDTIARTMLRRYNVTSGSLTSEFVSPDPGLVSQGFGSPFVYGGYVWGAHEGYSTVEFLYKIPEDLSTYTRSTYSGTIGSSTRVLATANGVFTNSYPGTVLRAAHKFNSSGVFQWYKYLSTTLSAPIDVCEYGTDTYWVGVRNNNWPGATGYANWWKLDSSGNITASADLVATRLVSCCVVGSDMFVLTSGRIASGITASGYANLLKIDLAGAIVDAYDFSQDDNGNDVIPYYVRANSTHIFVATSRKRK